MSITSRYTASGSGTRLTYEEELNISFNGSVYTPGIPKWSLDGGFYAEQSWYSRAEVVEEMADEWDPRDLAEILDAIEKAHAGEPTS